MNTQGPVVSDENYVCPSTENQRLNPYAFERTLNSATVLNPLHILKETEAKKRRGKYTMYACSIPAIIKRCRHAELKGKNPNENQKIDHSQEIPDAG